MVGRLGYKRFLLLLLLLIPIPLRLQVLTVALLPLRLLSRRTSPLLQQVLPIPPVLPCFPVVVTTAISLTATGGGTYSMVGLVWVPLLRFSVTAPNTPIPLSPLQVPMVVPLPLPADMLSRRTSRLLPAGITKQYRYYRAQLHYYCYQPYCYRYWYISMVALLGRNGLLLLHHLIPIPSR